MDVATARATIIFSRRPSRVARCPNRLQPQCATRCEPRALEQYSQAAIFWSRSYSTARVEAGSVGGGAGRRMRVANGAARRLRAPHTKYRPRSMSGASPPSSRYRPKVGRSWCGRATDALWAPIPPTGPRGGRAAARHDVTIDLGSFGGVQLAETSWRCYRASAALYAVAGSGGQ